MGEYYSNRALVWLHAGYYQKAIEDYDSCLGALALVKKNKNFNTSKLKRAKFEAYLHRGSCKRKIKIIQAEGEDLKDVKERKNKMLMQSIADLKIAS
jgi:hypothetical protein